MSTFIFFFHVHLFPFIGPEAQDICSPPFNKYSFFFYCLRSYWSIFAFLHESYGLN